MELGWSVKDWTSTGSLPAALHDADWAWMTRSADPPAMTATCRPQAVSSEAMPFGLPFCTAKTTNSFTQSTKSFAPSRSL